MSRCVPLCGASEHRGRGCTRRSGKNRCVRANLQRALPETSIYMTIETPVPEPEAVEESEPVETEITAEKETEPAPPAESTLRATSKSAPASSDPKPGTIAIIDGNRCMWITGFGWVKDEGGGSIGIVVDGKGDINKQVGVMGGGGTTVGNPGDKLTGNNVGIMGASSSGTIAEDMYENGHKIGIMSGSESPSSVTIPPASRQLEPIEGEINIVFVEVPEKNSTPPPYKPDTTSP